jgi:hypothetical protein
MARIVKGASAGLATTTVARSDLARSLLAKEITGEADPRGLSQAAERVGQKLSRRLSRSVSAAGSQAMVSRALHLTRAEFPFLEGVCAGTPPEACFEGLIERVHNVEAGEALVALLGTLLDLLVGFIGEDLTMRLVREVWPELPLLEPNRPGNPDGQEANS